MKKGRKKADLEIIRCQVFYHMAFVCPGEQGEFVSFKTIAHDTLSRRWDVCGVHSDRLNVRPVP